MQKTALSHPADRVTLWTNLLMTQERDHMMSDDHNPDDGFFDSTVAKNYDRNHGGTDERLIESTVDLLQDLSRGGPILEFAIGTGLIALPLSRRGCKVKGIELSRAMVGELRKKETDGTIEVAIGDMTSTRYEEKFSLVFLVFNTIDNLTTQEAQIACFRNAAHHLEAGGRFLVETQVPAVQRIPFGEKMTAFACSADHFGVDEIDIATQRYSSNHVWMKDGTFSHVRIPFRYAWPAELDLMARLAGMELEHRWSDWHRSAFTHLSKSHVSVWRKVGA